MPPVASPALRLLVSIIKGLGIMGCGHVTGRVLEGAVPKGQ